MPTYEYACTKCGQHVEVFQNFNDEPLTACGVCGGPLRKVFHAAGILFKGSGFYATDNRKGRPSSDGGTGEKRKESAAAEKQSSKASEGKPGGAEKAASKEKSA